VHVLIRFSGMFRIVLLFILFFLEIIEKTWFLCFQPILVWVTIAMMKHRHHKQVGEKRVYLAFSSTSIVHH
jgi:predicted tellurium resistance membrane protein TerC